MSRTISNTITTGLTLVPGDTPLTIANTGVVSYGVTGSTALYGPAGTTWIVTNLGTISDTGAGWGVNFAADGTVINGGLIAADVAANSAIGVYLSVGGSVTNQSGGTITGHNGVKASNVAATVVNAGRINLDSTSAAQGVLLNAGGSVTNQSGGVILGYDSVLIQGGTSASVVNAGSIGAINRGIALDVSGSVTNLSTGTITSSGLAPGGPVAGTAVSAGIYKRVTLVNAGSIGANASYGVGIYFAYGQLVSNQAGGVITALNAVRLGRGTVINAGSIGGNTTYGTGVSIASAGGIVTNQSGGTIAGQVAVKLNRGTVVNAGVIAGDAAGYGVSILGAVGTVTNQAGGAISGFVGVQFIGGTATNAGVITGYTLSGYGFGMRLFGRGTVSNLSTGTIRASTGVTLASGTLENAGTIVGVAGTAVAFSATAANRVIVDPGAVFSGTVDGGNTIGASFASTLELASGASAGTLNSLGSQFIHFANITVDAGAAWSIASGSIGSGYTITDAGTLTNAGTLGSAITLGSGAILTNASAGVISTTGTDVVASAGLATVVNAGKITVSSASGLGLNLAVGGSVTNRSGGVITALNAVRLGRGTVINAGSIGGNTLGGTGVNITIAGGVVTNQSGGTITGKVGVALIQGTLVNAGTIAGHITYVYGTSGGYGVSILGTTGTVTNQAGGAISGYVGVQFFNGTEINAGIVSGNTLSGYGIRALDGGSVINLSTGTISAAMGVTIPAGTVENAGTIVGVGGTAVAFGTTAANRVIVDPGAVFSGIVDGGNTIGATFASTLELASAASAGTLSGLGTQLVNFAQVTIDNGATWTLSGTASGFTTLSNAGNLLSGVTLGSGDFTVSNESTGTIGNSNTSGTALYAASAITVANAGSIGGDTDTGIGVYMAAGGTLTNQATGTISGGANAVKFAADHTSRLVIAPNSTFSGTVDGGNTIGATSVSTLELASAATAGTLNGLGVYYTGFSTITIDSGARWALAGSNTLGAGITLTDNGTLTDRGTLVSAGRITGAATGILLTSTAQFTNQSGGTITGSTVAVNSAGIAFVVNSGAIVGGSIGVSLASGGGITNASGGVITGYKAINVPGAAATLVNAGSIGGDTVGTAGVGAGFGHGGLISNQSGGTITGKRGIYGSNTLLTVTNAGTIAGSGTAGMGVYLKVGGTLTNQTGGTILGYEAVLIKRNTNTAAAVVNAGSIGGARRGVDLASAGTITNLATGTITSSGLGLSGTNTDAAVLSGQSGGVTLLNAGRIAANTTTGDGVNLASYDSVTNQTSGTISGYVGVRIAGYGTLVNAGNITGHGYGYAIRMTARSASVVNQAGGTISGEVAVGLGQNATLVNAGNIVSSDTLYGFGIHDNANGAVITNQSGGLVSGGDGMGLFAATVINAGSIAGNVAGDAPAGYGYGININSGSVTNLSTGTIRGVSGVVSTGGTLRNAGSVVGSGGTAVAFGTTAANRVIFDPGAVFSGIVDGGNTIGATFASTLELASGASAGTLSGLGTQFVHFAAITIDSGASWTLGGTNTVATGSTFTDSGTLINSGTVTGSKIRLSGGALTNQASGLLTVAYVYGVAAGGTDTVVNAGTIASSAANAIYLAAAGNVSNAANGAIGGYGDGVKLKGVNATLNNLGRITGSAPTGSYGAYLRNGGLVTNGQAGTGTSTASLRGYYGVAFKTADTVNAVGTLFNYGSVTGYGSASSAVLMDNAGIVVNGASGASGAGAALIQGGRFGVSAGFATITNYATILATGTAGGDYGVFVSNTGLVRNLGTASLIRGYAGVQIGTDGTVINAGTIASSQGTTGVAISFIGGNARLIDNPGAVFVGTVNGGSGGTAVLELASGSSAGTISGLGTSITNFTSLVFDAGARWTVQANASAAGLGTLAISGFSDNDTIDLSGFVAVDETFADNQLVLTNASSAHVTLGVQGTFTTSNFALASDLAGGTDITVICFADDTMIATPAGEVPVQNLAADDLVMTAHNGPRPVQWIGMGKVLSTRGRRTAATPVIVYKNALGPNLPHHDLRITKAHSLYIDDVLIPVEFLVNHRTIVWDDRAQEVEIYHVELESHDILIANGVPAESYRDDGNRWLFQNANSGWGLPPQTPYAPVLTGGPVVDAVWARLLLRAGPRSLPPTTDDPDLHLIADGVRVDVAASNGQDRVFFVSGTPDSIRIVSRDAIPAELGIARDPRALGVAVREIVLERGLSRVRIAADDPRLTDGFHDYEPSGDRRWTNGDASLPAELSGFGALRVVLTLAGATRYVEWAEAAAA